MKKDLENRTKRFGLAVIKYCSTLPRTRAADVLGRQLLRSATSIGANYREANRGVSRADFVNKMALSKKKRLKRSTGSNFGSNHQLPKTKLPSFSRKPRSFSQSSLPSVRS